MQINVDKEDIINMIKAVELMAVIHGLTGSKVTVMPATMTNMVKWTGMRKIFVS